MHAHTPSIFDKGLPPAFAFGDLGKRARESEAPRRWCANGLFSNAQNNGAALAIGPFGPEVGALAPDPLFDCRLIAQIRQLFRSNRRNGGQRQQRFHAYIVFRVAMAN